MYPKIKNPSIIENIEETGASESDYFICEASFMETDGVRVFNTLQSCKAYILADATGSRVGTIYIKARASGSWDISGTQCEFKDSDWSSNVSNPYGWSNLRIVVDNESALNGHVLIESGASPGFNISTFYTFDPASRTFNRSTGAGTLNTSVATYPFIAVVHSISGFIGIFPVASLTSTVAVLDTFLGGAGNVQIGGQYQIQQLSFWQRNIQFKGAVKVDNAFDDDYVFRINGIDGFYHEGLVYSEQDGTHNQDAFHIRFSKAKIGHVRNFIDVAANDAIVYAERSDVEFESITNTSGKSPLQVAYSNVVGKLIANSTTRGPGGGVQVLIGRAEIQRIVNCSVDDSSDGYGGGVYISGTGNASAKIGSIESCTAYLTGGGIYCAGSGNHVEVGLITKCVAQYGSAVSVAGDNYSLVIGLMSENEATADGGTIAYDQDRPGNITFGMMLNNTGTPSGIWCGSDILKSAQIQGNFTNHTNLTYFVNNTDRLLSGKLRSENYFLNDRFIDDIQYVRTYADTAGVAPIDGVGGTPNLTIAKTSLSVRGPKSLSIAKDAANRQGQGVAFDFSIESADQGRVLQVSFELKVASGTFVPGDMNSDGDITVWVYDSDSNLIIPLSDRKIYGGTGGLAYKYIGNFQASSIGTNYSLLLHTTSTSTLAWTVLVASMEITPSRLISLAAITDWQAFPSVAAGTLITGSTSNPTYGTIAQNVAYWRRVGDSMEIVWDYRHTAAGSAGSGIYLFNLPLGYQVDATRLPANTSQFDSVVGDFKVFSANAGTDGVGKVAVYSTTQLWVQIFRVTLTPGVAIDVTWAASSSAINFSSGTDMTYCLRATIPIAGWGSAITSALTGDDGRAIAMNASGSINTATTAQNITWATTTRDSHNAYSASTGEFTAPVSADYQFCGLINTDLGSGQGVYSFINGATSSILHGASSGNGYVAFVGQVYLTAGQKLSFRPTANIGAVGGGSHLDISRVGGNAIASMATGAGRTAFTSITAEYTSASTTWVEVLSLAIIPKYASSKICIRSMLTLSFYTDNSILVSARILKNGTPIATFTNIAGVGIGTPIAPTQATPLEWTEDAGSVDTRTYSIEFRRESYAGGYGGTAYVNSGGNRLSTLKLIEEIQ